MHEPDTRHRFVSVREAADYLGISETEVRRRIKSGSLEAERLTRPQGTILRVRLDMPTQTPSAAIDAPAPTDAQPRAVSEEMLGVVKALIHSHADIMARQGEMIAELREERGVLAEQVRHERARAERAEAERDAERAKSWLDHLLGR